MKQFIYGFHSIEEMLKKGKTAGCLFYSSEKGRRSHLIELAKGKKIKTKRVNPDELDEYCEKKKHRGIIFVLYQQKTGNKKDLKEYKEVLDKETAFILVLDAITDPHNYGAILRSADQFSVDLVVIPDRKSARDTDTVSVTSAGANLYVRQVSVPNLIQAVEFLKTRNFWVYGADTHGERIDRSNLKGRIVLVMGSEGKGIRSLLKEKCDMLLRIPTSGHIDSLNVSVAAGIFIYEIRRQQGI